MRNLDGGKIFGDISLFQRFVIPFQGFVIPFQGFAIPNISYGSLFQKRKVRVQVKGELGKGELGLALGITNLMLYSE